MNQNFAETKSELSGTEVNNLETKLNELDSTMNDLERSSEGWSYTDDSVRSGSV